MQQTFMLDRIRFSFRTVFFTFSPSFIDFRDSAVCQPAFPYFKHIVIVQLDFKTGNMGYCYNYPKENALKTGIMEKSSECKKKESKTLAISNPKHYTVQVCVNCKKAYCPHTTDD